MTVPGRTLVEGEVLWEPKAHELTDSNLARYLQWLGAERKMCLADYDALWRWSVANLPEFWGSIADYFDLKFRMPPGAVLSADAMPGARWFPGATLNYTEHALRHCDDGWAVIHRNELGQETRLTGKQLCDQVARAATGLRKLGVQKGDRVAAILPNTPEALIAFLATAALGAIWSSCSPEFGTPAILDRFAQIEPKVLLAVERYRYGGKIHERVRELDDVMRGLPRLEHTVVVPMAGDVLGSATQGAMSWADLVAVREVVEAVPVPFDHPLWILYSSGTTGLPKPIVHAHGGILLEHYKALSLHCDLGPGDRFFWYTTTGWMMWNFLVSGLLVGATVVLYDGSPTHPGFDSLWKLASELEVAYLGLSAPFIMACRKEGLEPGKRHSYAKLRTVGSTGAPLPIEGFAWVYDSVKRDVVLGSMSGGSDVCTAFVLSAPILPVRAGELQCRGLGCKVEAFDESGKSVVGEVGELVLTAPIPSMPIMFWHDGDGSRLHEAYFARYDGVWHHGDWIKITPHGGCVIYGRSDSTLNRGGVRMGTSEFYRVVETLPGIEDSVVVDTGELGREGRLWLFVVPTPGTTVDDSFKQRVKQALRERVSPRHVPDEIHGIASVPRTLNGKKLEVPVKKLLNGVPLERAANPETLANPESIRAIAALAASLRH